MLLLVDTNVLLRLVEPKHVQHATAVEAATTLDALGHVKVVVPQVVYEFWAVATRPVDANGLGLTADDTKSKLDGILSTCHILRDERTIYEQWWRLVLDYEVKGKQVHDARLVAAMLRHSISHLLTFNASDFARYSDIVVIGPLEVGSLEPAT